MSKLAFNVRHCLPGQDVSRVKSILSSFIAFLGESNLPALFYLVSFRVQLPELTLLVRLFGS